MNISNLNSSSRNLGTDEDNAKERGYIVVETNYRVFFNNCLISSISYTFFLQIYAYTESTLQTALLTIFADILYRFPNLVVAVLTRESVRQAFRGGITANQIIKYLEQYAHPDMYTETAIVSKSPLPPTIVDQIKLWENERNRFTYTEGVVYNQFLSQADFITLRDYAQSINVLVWQNERSRTMVVTKNGHEDVKKFWKRYSKSGS